MCKKYRIGIDAGGTKVAYGLFDADGQLLDRMQHPSDINADGPAFSDRMIETIREIEMCIRDRLKGEPVVDPMERLPELCPDLTPETVKAIRTYYRKYENR